MLRPIVVVVDICPDVTSWNQFNKCLEIRQINTTSELQKTLTKL